MTDVDGQKIKKGDQVWVYDPHLERLRLARVHSIKASLAKILWLTPIASDPYTGASVGPGNLVRCTGQD